MIRSVALLAVLAACSGSEAKDNPPKTAEKDVVAVPGGSKGATGPTVGAGPTEGAPSSRMGLQPEEGTLAIGKAEAKAGSEATAKVAVKPGAGYHISLDFPISLALEPPAGVKLAKAELTAGRGQKGDADEFTEQGLAFAVKATADKVGSYDIKAMFKFGVCDKESCHPKKQPISITVTAN